VEDEAEDDEGVVEEGVVREVVGEVVGEVVREVVREDCGLLVEVGGSASTDLVENCQYEVIPCNRTSPQ